MFLRLTILKLGDAGPAKAEVCIQGPDGFLLREDFNGRINGWAEVSEINPKTGYQRTLEVPDGSKVTRVECNGPCAIEFVELVQETPDV